MERELVLGGVLSWATVHFSSIASRLLRAETAKFIAHLKRRAPSSLSQRTLLHEFQLADGYTSSTEQLPVVTHDINGTMLVFSCDIFYVRSPHLTVYQMLPFSRDNASGGGGGTMTMQLPEHAFKLYDLDRDAATRQQTDSILRNNTEMQKSIWLLHMLLSDLRALIFYRRGARGDAAVITDLSDIIEPFLYVISNITQEKMPARNNNNNAELSMLSRATAFATGFFIDTPLYEARLDAAALLHHLHAKGAIRPLIERLRQMPRDTNMFYEAQDHGREFKPWRDMMLRPRLILRQPPQPFFSRRPASTTVWDVLFIQTLEFKPRGEGEDDDSGYSEYQLARRRFGNSTSVGKLAYSLYLP